MIKLSGTETSVLVILMNSFDDVVTGISLNQLLLSKTQSSGTILTLVIELLIS